MSRYHIEVEVNDEAEGYEEYGFLSYGTIVGEGNSLKECLLSATVDLIDQDGGTFRDDVEADDDWMQDAVEKAFMRKYPPPGMDALELEQRGREFERVRMVNGRGR